MESKRIPKASLEIYMNDESECEESELSDEGEEFGWVDDSFEANVELPETSSEYTFLQSNIPIVTNPNLDLAQYEIGQPVPSSSTQCPRPTLVTTKHSLFTSVPTRPATVTSNPSLFTSIPTRPAIVTPKPSFFPSVPTKLAIVTHKPSFFPSVQTRPAIVTTPRPSLFQAYGLLCCSSNQAYFTLCLNFS